MTEWAYQEGRFDMQKGEPVSFRFRYPEHEWSEERSSLKPGGFATYEDHQKSIRIFVSRSGDYYREKEVEV